MSYPDENLVGLFTEERVTTIGDIVRDEESNDVYVQVPLTIGSDGSKSPSRPQIFRLKDAFERLGLHLHILLFSGVHEEFEQLIRATLFLAFPDALRNVFCSLGVRNALVWIEPKRELSLDLKKAIERAAKKFCEVQDFDFQGLVTVGEANTPGKLAILSALRAIAPADIETLYGVLAGKGFVIPSRDWLLRRLDAYRKSGNLVFISDKKYVLTVQSLSQLGTSKKGTTSPDIGRLLALWKESR